MDDQREEPLKDEAEKRRDWRGSEGNEVSGGQEEEDAAKPAGGPNGQFAPPD